MLNLNVSRVTWLALSIQTALGFSASAKRYEPEVLERIVEKITVVARSGHVPVVIFDLDDTIIDTKVVPCAS